MKYLFIMLLLGWTVYASAQQTKKYPLEQYEELTDNKPHDSSKIWSQVVQPRFAWGSIDVRYPKKSVPKKLSIWFNYAKELRSTTVARQV